MTALTCPHCGAEFEYSADAPPCPVCLAPTDWQPDLGESPDGTRRRQGDERDDGCPGLWWITCEALSHGDYGGYGSHGLANIRVLADHAERPDWFPDGEEHTDTTTGMYSHQQAWCLDTVDNRELLTGLVRNYPVLDDQATSEVEREWETEALDSYGWSDMGKSLEADGEEVRELWDELRAHGTGTTQWDFYDLARADSNTYPEPEYNGIALRLDDERFAASLSTVFAHYVLSHPIGQAMLTADLADATDGQIPPPADWTAVAGLAALADNLTEQYPGWLSQYLTAYVRFMTSGREWAVRSLLPLTHANVTADPE